MLSFLLVKLLIERGKNSQVVAKTHGGLYPVGVGIFQPIQNERKGERNAKIDGVYLHKDLL